MKYGSNQMGQVAIGTSPVYKFYFKNTLEKLGITPYFMQTGKYKTYAEMFTQDSMSDEVASQISMITEKIDKKMAEV